MTTKPANSSSTPAKSKTRKMEIHPMADVLPRDLDLLQTLIDTLPDRIYIKDPLGRKVITNKADWKASGGKKMQDVLGKSDFDLYPPELANEFYEDDKRVLETGKPVINREERGLGKHRRQVWVLSTKMPIHDRQGNIAGLIGVGREITRLKRTEDELQHQSIRLQIVADMAQAASSTLDVHKLLNRMAGLIQERFHYYSVTIYLFDETGESVILHSASGNSARELIVAGQSYPLNYPGIISRVAQTGKGIFIPDTRTDKSFIPHSLLPDTTSEAIFPLLVRKKVIGVLDIQNNRIHSFPPQAISILRTLAAQLAIAIQNASSYKQIALKNGQLEELSQATTDIMDHLGKASLDNLLSLVSKKVVKLLDAEVCGVHLVKRPGFLKLTAGYGHREDGFPKGLELPIVSGFHTGLTGHIAAEGVLFNAYGDKLYNHPAVKGEKQSHLPSGKCYSLLAIPLYRQDGGQFKLVGLLRAENKKKNGRVSPDVHFTLADEWILNVFANTIVVAIQRARLLNQIEASHAAARQIARVSTIGNIDKTLESIVDGAKSALGGDIATVYTYDDKVQRFLKVKNSGCDVNSLVPPEKVTRTSTVSKIMQQGKAVLRSEDVPADIFFSGHFARKEKIKSTLAVKLRFGRQPVGVLFINFKYEHHFTQVEINDAIQFGHQAAIAIRNAQLFHETSRTFTLLKALNLQLTSAQPLKKALGLIIQQAVTLTGLSGDEAEYGYISLVEGERLQCQAAWPEGTLSNLQKVIGDIDLKGNGRIGITGRSVKLGQPVKESNVSQNPDYLCINKTINAELAVPIRYGNQVIGVINVEHHNREAFNDYDVEMLKQLADHVANIIQTAKHYEGLKHDAQLQEGLLKVGQAIIATREPEKLLKILVDKIKEALQADIVSLFTYHQPGNEADLLVNLAGKLLDPQSKKQLNNPSDHSIVREILKRKQPVFANDTLHHPLMSKGDFSRQEKVRSSAGIPLMIGNDPGGLLFVNYRHPHQFSEQQQKDLILFATQAALAIQNARHSEDIKRQRSLVASRTAVAFQGLANSIWGHSIEGRAINIRNMVTVMRQDLQLYDLPSDKMAQLNRRIEIIESQAISILEKEMVPQLSMDTAPVLSVGDLLQERIAGFKLEETARHVPILLSAEKGLCVKIAPEWFKVILDILINNAIEAMHGVPNPRMTICSSAMNNRVEIAISDAGHGIPPMVREKILNSPIEHTTAQEGQGMGLLMVQMILESYKGSIWLEETGPNGTTFVVALPKVDKNWK